MSQISGQSVFYAAQTAFVFYCINDKAVYLFIRSFVCLYDWCIMSWAFKLSCTEVVDHSA